MQQPGYRRLPHSTAPPACAVGLARFVALPENASALTAVRVFAQDPEPAGRLLLVHGPTGTGKSCLVTALAEELADRSVCSLSANAFPLPWDQDDPAAAERCNEARRCDLLIVEDLHHLPARATETLVEWLDERERLGLPTVVTANAGPAQLSHRGEALPVRLTSRLAAGLVVALEPLGVASRRVFLMEQARRRGMDIAPSILDWLAVVLTGGGRQLEGALNRLAVLAAPTLDEVRTLFAEQMVAGQPTVERVVRRVSAYYRVEARQLRSARRQRSLLIPRQVSMYLLRRLTSLSLAEIGACFGGRDHSTVLHACRRVEEAIQRDARLSGAVQQLQAEFV